MVQVILDDKNVFVCCNGGEVLYEPKNNMWLWLLGAIKDSKKIVITDERANLQEHQSLLSCTINNAKEKRTEIPETAISKAKQCLIDNGIEADEAETVLQALGYILDLALDL